MINLYLRNAHIYHESQSTLNTSIDIFKAPNYACESVWLALIFTRLYRCSSWLNEEVRGSLNQSSLKVSSTRTVQRQVFLLQCGIIAKPSSRRRNSPKRFLRARSLHPFPQLSERNAAILRDSNRLHLSALHNLNESRQDFSTHKLQAPLYLLPADRISQTLL